MVADRLLGVGDLVADPGALKPYERAPFSEGFIVQLVQRLRDQDPETTPAVGWLEEPTGAQGTTADELVREEHQRQGASNVTVRNIITSMRLISDVDWPELFEEVSLVDAVLRAGSDFAAMDFATRNLYRTAIEETRPRLRPRRSWRLRVARWQSHRGLRHCDGDRRQRDPGYHLIGGGRRAFERSLGFRPPGLALRRRFHGDRHRGLRRQRVHDGRHCSLLPLLALYHVGSSGWQLAALVLLGLLPAIDVALTLVNRAVTGGFGATLPARPRTARRRAAAARAPWSSSRRC